jgi:hypothetical protein
MWPATDSPKPEFPTYPAAKPIGGSPGGSRQGPDDWPGWWGRPIAQFVQGLPRGQVFSGRALAIQIHGHRHDFDVLIAHRFALNGRDGLPEAARASGRRGYMHASWYSAVFLAYISGGTLQIGRQAVPPVSSQNSPQMPAMTTHAAPAPNSASQSVSRLQSRQSGSAPPVKSPQNGAFPVVTTHWQKTLLGLQTCDEPVVQKSNSTLQMLTSCATQRLLSAFPFFGFDPSQMPEQHFVLSPLQAFPTSRQPYSFGFGFFGLRFFFFAAAKSGSRAAPSPSPTPARPRTTSRRDGPLAINRVRAPKCVPSMICLLK